VGRCRIGVVSSFNEAGLWYVIVGVEASD